MIRLLCTAVAAAALFACSSNLRSACEKEQECCATMSHCEEINRKGPGWVDRCEIDTSSRVRDWQTFKGSPCDTIASTYADLIECLSSLSCADATSTGHVAKCDAKAVGFCNARKASGDACGRDDGTLLCGDATASLIFY